MIKKFAIGVRIEEKNNDTYIFNFALYSLNEKIIETIANNVPESIKEFVRSGLKNHSSKGKIFYDLDNETCIITISPFSININHKTYETKVECSEI